MRKFATPADVRELEAEMPWAERDVAATTHEMLERVAAAHPDRPAVSFQLLSGPKDKAETLTWAETRDQVYQIANLLRDLGIGETDTVAFVLPNSTETFLTLIAGAIAGAVAPVNPLLDFETIAGVLAETKAKVVVTLRAFPKTDVAEKVAEAVRLTPGVETVLEVDLLRHLTPPKSWIVPLVRPKVAVAHKARVLDFETERRKRPTTLAFTPTEADRVAAYFHTGGTTGLPKVARHRYSGMVYNGWLAATLLFDETDSLMCPLPLFHVLAAQVLVNAALSSGAHLVLPTPAGYRGEGVFDNFWKLVERYRITFIITVPTAVAALMQRKVDADVSSVRSAISGSAPLPLELFRRFEEATGVKIMEGYGLTEATCLVSCNPYEGVKKVGSVGFPLPYTDVRILIHTSDGGAAEVETGDIGEICISNPGVVVGRTYTETTRNHDLFHRHDYLRTGDLGRIDEDGYLWITGRAKDLIIRGGHNIDPAVIEEALAGHDAVAFAGAIGQPDPVAGELPCAYVELVSGARTTPEALIDFATSKIGERAAIPKHVEILDELPKTAVGKVFKPDLRKRAIRRVLDAAFEAAGLPARVSDVAEQRQRGLVARIEMKGAPQERVEAVLATFTVPYDLADRPAEATAGSGAAPP